MKLRLVHATALMSLAIYIAGCNSSDTTDPNDRNMMMPPPGMMPPPDDPPPPPPPEKIAVKKTDIKAAFVKNFTNTMSVVSNFEDMSAEMEMFEDLDIKITHDEDCDDTGDTTMDPMDPNMMPPPTQDDPCEDTRSAEERAKSIAESIADEIFKDENLETEEDKQVVYRMEIECEEDEEEPRVPDPDPGPGNGMDPGMAPNQEDPCEPTEMRMAFTSYKEGDLNIDMMMGEDKLKMLTIELHQDSSGVVVDLADVQALMDEFNEIIDTSTDGIALPDVLKGKIVGELLIPGDGTYTGSFGIRESLEIASTKGDKTYRLAVEAVDSAGSMTFDTMMKSITGALNMKSVDVELMSQIFEAEVLNDGKLKVHVGGFGGSITLTESADNDVFRINDINMGTESTYAEFNGQRTVTIDLNENAGRKFSLAARNPEEGVELGFDPLLDFKIAFTQTPFFNQNSEDKPPEWITEETYQLTIDNATMPKIVLMFLDDLFEDDEPIDDAPQPPPTMSGGMNPDPDPPPPGEPMEPNGEEDEDDGPTDLVKIIDGMLTLKAVKANKEVSVSAGKCLVAGDDPEPEPGMMGGAMNPNPMEDEEDHLLDILRSADCQPLQDR